MNILLLITAEAIKPDSKTFMLADAIVFFMFFIAVAYLLIYALASLTKRKDTYPTARRKYRYAVMFPAFQQDEALLESVRSFNKQDYPREYYDIYVVGEQLLDDTIFTLRDMGTYVIDLEDAKSTKTIALQEGIRFIDSTGLKYDYVVVLDADNLVDPYFLETINDAFYSGCPAVQTHRIAKSLDTDFAVLDAVSEEINNSIFRKGHTQLGFSSALIGSGMAFEYDLFKENIKKSGSLGADKQLERRLLESNVYIEYLEAVFTYDEKVKKSANFYQQRRQWMANQFSNLFHGIFRLPLALLTGKWDYCDKLLQWMMPPRVILFGLIILFSLVMSVVDFDASIKWWGLLLLLCITFSLAIPSYLINARLTKAILRLPVLFIMMFANMFRIFGTEKSFQHIKNS